MVSNLNSTFPTSSLIYLGSLGPRSKIGWSCKSGAGRTRSGRGQFAVEIVVPRS